MNIINTILGLVLLVALGALLVATAKVYKTGGLISAINSVVASEVATHCGCITKLTDAALPEFYLLVKTGSDAAHVALCGAGDEPLGIASDSASAAEQEVNVDFLGATERTRKVVASEAIAIGDKVYTAANARVQNEPAVAGSYYLIGQARTAAGAAGDVIEVETIKPIKVVVVAAFTSTNGTAAGAADLAALKAEVEKVGDDVRSLGAALATPALVKVLA